MAYHPQDGEALIECDGQEAGVISLAEYLRDQHEMWKPHQGQQQLGWALFYGAFKDIFACCGRNWGKTEAIAYCTTRYANERPKSENYIFGPIQKQVKEILWASQRIQNFAPEKYREAVNNTEMRITFSNQAFIKLDGSNNVDDYRGIKPKGLSTYDERKDFKKAFIDAYDPNRAAFDSPAIHIGTPPEVHNEFVDTMQLAQKEHLKGWFYLHAPSAQNPHISARFLENKRRQLIEAGEEETWLREYMAIFVKGGKRHVFPQFLRHQKRTLSDVLPKDLNRWKLVVHCDPATTSIFGVLISLFNPYTRKLILVDELYEDRMEKMTTRQIWGAIDEKVAKWKTMGIKPDMVEYGYDEAAAWFMNETSEARPSIWLVPTKKHEYGREEGISMIRDIFLKELIQITDQVPKFTHEMENYMKDENGKIPKENDHQIDNLAYTLQMLGYTMDEKIPPKEPDPNDQPRAHRIEDDFAEDFALEEIGPDLL